LPIDPLTQLAFSVYESKGVFALLLGSGLSRAAGVPTGWEITLDLIRRLASAQSVEDQTDWARWYRDTEKEEPSYSRLLEGLASSPSERRSILHSYIEPTEEDRKEGHKVPTAAHYAIADLVRSGYIKVLVTTNFDRLIENALRERGLEPTVVASVDALAGAEPISHSPCYIVKLHGDYKDDRIRNTEVELSKYPKKFDRLLDRILDEFGLIVSGWSGDWDHALRAALLRAPNRRYPTYWTARGEVSGSARQLVDHRRARIVPISDADTFFERLHQQVETLERSHRPNPVSVDLLVGSAKRLLAKPEHRIQLDELFENETDRTLGLIRASVSPSPQLDQAEFRDRVAKYEAATEALARMAGVLGRWGHGAELQLARDTIGTLFARTEDVTTGFAFHPNIRSYPAVLVFTAYGLGLTRAERWSDLHGLLDAVIVRQQDGPFRAVEALFLGAWKGADDARVWRQLEELERHNTPLSEHLFSLFSEWSESFGRLTSDFELSFQRFEMLASLAYLEKYSAAEVVAALESKTQQPFIWMPVGRSGWRTHNADRLIEEFRGEPIRRRLADAGFGRGDPHFFDLFVRNFRPIPALMRRGLWP
jgi:hypothetical protein